LPDTVEHRRELKEKGQMGCPKTLNYPLDTEEHVRAAATYYSRDDTIKCQGFWGRWCTAAKRVGLKTPLVDEKCK
jgi:hypothetical protein